MFYIFYMKIFKKKILYLFIISEDIIHCWVKKSYLQGSAYIIICCAKNVIQRAL
jgi:hypothetical protein